MKKIINIVCFCVMIYSFFTMYILKLDSKLNEIIQPGQNLQTIISGIDNYYRTEDISRNSWIELYGLSQRIMGKEQIENFTIFKNDSGGLVALNEKINTNEIEKDVDDILSLISYCNEKEIPAYYITSLLPVTDDTDLPIGAKDYSVYNAEKLMKELEKSDLSIIDLRDLSIVQNTEKGMLFYKTDHHWTLETCFAAFQYIIESIEKELEWKIDEKYTTVDSYEKDIIQECFLGSYGIKVGKYYAGKDDFVLYVPNYETKFKFESYENNQLKVSKTGDFVEALMDIDILRDENYNNKYNSFLNGQTIENRIVNCYAPNDRKVLLISHSYGRPLAQYLGLCFSEVRHIDPQSDRYTNSISEYINSYKPDLVLIMAEFEGEWIVDICMD